MGPSDEMHRVLWALVVETETCRRRVRSCKAPSPRLDHGPMTFSEAQARAYAVALRSSCGMPCSGTTLAAAPMSTAAFGMP